MVAPSGYIYENRRGVIDIGSNSVRLVIYGGPARTPIGMFNEKVLCGLGILDPDTGLLRRAAMDEALSVLRRFKNLVEMSGPIPLKVFATAAVRESNNGAAFIKEINELGLSPVVFSGQQEAYYASLGVLSGTPKAALKSTLKAPNYCGDMGGGSLELTKLSDNPLKPLSDFVSLPLGPLRLMSEFGKSVERAESFVDNHLFEHDWLSEKSGQMLYAVGGAWRTIAKIHMAHTSYPLPILHQYAIQSTEIISLCEMLMHEDLEQLTNLPQIQRRRLVTLPHAAMVLKKVLEVTQVKSMEVSSFGVREGVLYGELSTDMQTEDPLISLAKKYAELHAPNPNFSKAVFKFTDQLFPDESKADRRIRKAVCTLCDIALMQHADMRALHGYDFVLDAPFSGLTHKERAFMAASLFFRHKSKVSALPQNVVQELLTPQEIEIAVILGSALRFAADYAASTAKLIRYCEIKLKSNELIFKAPASMEQLMGEGPMKRLSLLAQATKRGLRIEYRP